MLVGIIKNCDLYTKSWKKNIGFSSSLVVSNIQNDDDVTFDIRSHAGTCNDVTDKETSRLADFS